MLWNQPPGAGAGLAPSDAWSSGGSYLYGQTDADNFTLSSDSEITRITFWGSASGSASPELTNFSGWEIRVLNSNHGQLTDITIDKASLNPVYTGHDNAFGGKEYQFTFDTSISLAAGNYWLNVGAVQVDLNADGWYWSRSTTGDSDGQYSVNGFAAGWFPVSGDAAFQVEGQPVPEPTALTAVGLGVVALIRKRRK